MVLTVLYPVEKQENGKQEDMRLEYVATLSSAGALRSHSISALDIWLSSRHMTADLYPFSSLITVHGLNGDAGKTWTHPKTKAFWPKDFLPLDVPGIRVMTFGYNADNVGNTTAGIVDHAIDLLGSLSDNREEENVSFSLQPKDVYTRANCIISRSNGGPLSSLLTHLVA